MCAMTRRSPAFICAKLHAHASSSTIYRGATPLHSHTDPRGSWSLGHLSSFLFVSLPPSILEYVKLLLQKRPLVLQKTFLFLEGGDLFCWRGLSELLNSLGAGVRISASPEKQHRFGWALTCFFWLSSFSCAPVSAPTAITAANAVAHTPALNFVARDPIWAGMASDGDPVLPKTSARMSARY